MPTDFGIEDDDYTDEKVVSSAFLKDESDKIVEEPKEKSTMDKKHEIINVLIQANKFVQRNKTKQCQAQILKAITMLEEL